MESTRGIRAAGAAGLLAVVLIFSGLYLVTAWGAPGMDAAAEAWAGWAQREVLALEIGAYFLLVPGLLLFLCMFAALAGLLPVDAISRRLASYGALGFFVFFAAGGVLSTTTASTFDFYSAFDDPTAVTVLTGGTAGHHLRDVGVWGLAMTMVATAVGLRSSAAISMPLYIASIVLAALAVAGLLMGVGVVPCLIWIVAVGIGLLRWTRVQTDA
jgi:hypothetical protein